MTLGVFFVVLPMNFKVKLFDVGVFGVCVYVCVCKRGREIGAMAARFLTCDCVVITPNHIQHYRG